MSSTISSDKLRQEIQTILRNADLNTLSSKKVRQLLETLFQCDLTERKKEIDDIVMAEITARDMQPIPNNGEQRTTQMANEDGNDQQADSTAKGMEIQQQENRPTAQILNVMQFGYIFRKERFFSCCSHRQVQLSIENQQHHRRNSNDDEHVTIRN